MHHYYISRQPATAGTHKIYVVEAASNNEEVLRKLFDVERITRKKALDLTIGHTPRADQWQSEFVHTDTRTSGREDIIADALTATRLAITEAATQKRRIREKEAYLRTVDDLFGPAL